VSFRKNIGDQQARRGDKFEKDFLKTLQKDKLFLDERAPRANIESSDI